MTIKVIFFTDENVISLDRILKKVSPELRRHSKSKKVKLSL
jgi:hypothetical protein